MALYTKAGTFDAAIATGNQSVVGVGFTPRAILLWGSGATTNDTFQTAAFLQGIGFATSPTNQYAQCSTAGASSSTGTLRRVETSAFIQANTLSLTSIIRRANLVSMDSDGFTLNWTVARNNGDYDVLHYLALGGDDLTGAKVVNWQMPTVTGNKSVTGVGFQPDCVLHAHAGATTTLDATATQVCSLGLSAMTGTGDQWATDYTTTSTSAHARNQGSSKCLTMIGTTGTVVAQAAYTSMDSDGFTANFGVAPANAYQVISLCLQGGQYDAKRIIKPTAAAPVSQAVTGVGFTPKGVLLAGVQDIVRAAPLSGSGVAYGLGASDGASEWGSALYGAATATRKNISKSSKAYVKVNTTGSVIDAEADLTSFDADGYTLNWTTNDAVATSIPCLAMGSNAAGVAHPLTTTVAGTSSIAASAVRLNHPLSGAVSASLATAATSIRLTHPLASTVAGSSSVAGSLASPIPAYPDAVLATSGLVGYWRLGEASGTVAEDETANNRDGTSSGVVLGQPGLLTGDTNTAYGFDGNADRVSFGNILHPAGVSAFSWEIWVGPVTIPAGTYPRIASKERNYGSGTQGHALVLLPPEDGSGLLFTRSLTGTTNQVQVAYNTASPHYIVATYDGSMMRLYIDGLLAGSTASSLSMTIEDMPLLLGYDDWQGSPSPVTTVDEFAAYSVALSAATIADHYTKGTAAPSGAAHPLTTTVAGVSTVAATAITLSHPLATTVSATSATTATVVRISHPLSGAVAGSSTATATALRLTHPLASTVSASSTATAAALALSHPLAAGITAASSATASSIRLNHPLASTVAGTSSVSATLAPRSHPLTSAVTASSAVTAGGLTLSHPLTATTAAAATTAATGLAVGHALTATVGATSTATASSLRLEHPLAGSVSGASAVTASGIRLAHPLSGTVASTSAVTAERIALAHPLAVSIAATSTATASAITASHPLTTTVAGTSTVTGGLAAPTGAHPLTATIAGTSSVAASALGLDQPLTTVVAGSSTVAASGLRLDQPVTGAVTGSSTATAMRLVISHPLTATAAATSTATADRITLNHPLIAYSAGTSSVVALISLGHPLAAGVAGSSAVTAVFIVPITSAITFAAADRGRTFGAADRMQAYSATAPANGAIDAHDRPATYAATDPTITYDGGTR